MQQKFVVLILTGLFCAAGTLSGFGQTINFRGAEFGANAAFAAEQSEQIVYEGKMIDGVKWTDSNGENVLIVSEKRAAPKNGGASRQEIFAYQYATKNGKTRRLWRIYDVAENPCDAGKGLVSPIYLQDLDEDGVAENMFVYQVQGNCDVSPESYKLMLHSGATKLAVRGLNNVVIGNASARGKKEFDAEFDNFSPPFKTAASEFWDKYVKDSTGK